MKRSDKKGSNQIGLSVTNRTVLGKKVRKLRKEGTLPGNVYGNDIKSVAVSMKYADFAHVYRIVHQTGVVYLQLDKNEIPVMVKHIQRHPLDSSVLHVDFRKVDLTKKVVAEVPVKVIGVSEAVTQKGGVLLHQSPYLSVEALPQDVPNAIEVDISVLKELGQDIKVSDLPKNEKYSITTDSAKVVVSVTAHKEESVIAETTATAAPEVITAKVDAEGTTDPTELKEGKKEKGAPAHTSTEKEPVKK